MGRNKSCSTFRTTNAASVIAVVQSRPGVCGSHPAGCLTQASREPPRVPNPEQNKFVADVSGQADYSAADQLPCPHANREEPAPVSDSGRIVGNPEVIARDP